MRGWGWRREGCERAGLEEEMVCEGGVGGKEGCERVWLEEEKGCEGTGGVGLEKGKGCVRER